MYIIDFDILDTWVYTKMISNHVAVENKSHFIICQLSLQHMSYAWAWKVK